MDDHKMNAYLEAVNRSLKHLTVSEKTDILGEIKSHIKEAQVNQGITMDTALQNLGDPADLARAYAGQAIVNNASFTLRNMARIISFYGVTSLGGVFLSILAGGLYLSSFLALFGGMVKTGGRILGFNMSMLEFRFGDWLVPDMLALPVSVPVAVLLYYCSRKLWKLWKTSLMKASGKYRTPSIGG